MTPTNLDQSGDFEPGTMFPTSKGTLWILSNGRLWEQVGRRLVTEVTQWRGLLGSASARAMGMHTIKVTAPEVAIEELSSVLGIPLA